jgi:hypothetical protein
MCTTSYKSLHGQLGDHGGVISGHDDVECMSLGLLCLRQKIAGDKAAPLPSPSTLLA